MLLGLEMFGASVLGQRVGVVSVRRVARGWSVQRPSRATEMKGGKMNILNFKIIALSNLLNY